MTPKKPALVALATAFAVLCILPTASLGGKVDVEETVAELKKATTKVGSSLQQTVQQTDQAVRSTVTKTRNALTRAQQSAAKATSRATATDPQKQPPMHGSNPHGQGGVSVVDIAPSNERPLSGDPDGGDSGEDIVVGRARADQQTNGSYHGHITILGLFGNELAGVDTAPGETKNGPLHPIQQGVLDPLCLSTQGNICLSVLTANSTTNATGSTNDFAVASAKVAGLGAQAATSNASISNDANCQSAAGASKAANVTSSSTAVAEVADSAITSKSCRGAEPQVTRTSKVIALGGAGVPLPAAGCADGTPDTVAGIPVILPIICNAEEVVGAAAVREALDVYVLNAGTNSLAKETTAASEALTVAPAGPETAGSPQCSDTVDNDGDGKVDATDPGCHSDGDATNAASYVPADNDETDTTRGTTGSGGGGGDDDGDDTPECSDEVDNDGDGVIDARDPGCHTDGDPNNEASYDPDDDSEGGDGGAGDGGDRSALPFTGTDIVGIAFAGLLLLAGGLMLRRREGAVIGR